MNQMENFKSLTEPFYNLAMNRPMDFILMTMYELAKVEMIDTQSILDMYANDYDFVRTVYF